MNLKTNRIAPTCILCVLLLLLGGCGLPKPVATLDQFHQAQTRTYPGVAKTQVHTATEQLFTLADADDVRLTYEDQKLVARRLSLILFTVYEETWIINTQETPGSTTVTVSLDPTIDGTTLPPTGVGGYELFFARLDYLLGQSETWMTCYDYELARRENPTWGSMGEEYLCLNADDNLPAELRPTQPADLSGA